MSQRRPTPVSSSHTPEDAPSQPGAGSPDPSVSALSVKATRQFLPLIVVCSLTLLGLCAGLTAGARALLGSFRLIEADAMGQKAMQLYHAFDSDVQQLNISNRDYAEWDDTADYLLSGNPKYIAANFVAETLSGLHVDIAWIVAADGHDVYSCYLDRASGRIISPAPIALLQSLRPFIAQDQHLALLATADRLVRTPAGLASVAAMEIKRTDRTAPTGAIMLFARLIGRQEIQRIHTTSRLPVSVTYLTGGADKLAGFPAAVRDWLAIPYPSPRTLVLASDEHQITGYTVLRTIDHLPAAFLSTPAARDIFALGSRTTWYFLVGLLALFIVSGAAVAWLLLRLRRTLAAQREVEVRYQSIVLQLQEAIVLVDPSSWRILEANRIVMTALDCSAAELPGYCVQDIFPDISSEILEVAARDLTRRVIESRARRSHGRWSDVEVAVTAIEIPGRRLLTLVGHDVSHRREAEDLERSNRRKLLQLAQHDALTRLPNRMYLHAKLPRILKKAAVGNRLLALIYLDIDHFKNINDSRGHGCGDQLLQVIAGRLRAAVSGHNLVARMGGDEFVVVAPLLSGTEAAEHLAALLLTAIRAPLVLVGEPVSVTASLGIAMHPHDGLDIETLLKHADIALYQAKEAGRDCYRFFSQNMDIRVSEQVALEQSLRHAIGTDQLFMNYQPIIELRTGRMNSLEALMRWRHPEIGMIAPTQFIPVAEKSGLIVELGQVALRQVLAQLREWIDAKVPIVPIAVNVSPLQFDRSDFAALVVQYAREAGVDPSWLRFEITESALMKEPQKLIGTLKTLRSLGSQILIDDFGTGYSSLSYLNQMPVNTLKIDRAFVRDIGTDTPHQPIINAVIDMARTLHLSTVAEGVETAAQAALLQDLGCDFGQGFFYSKPVSARHCLALLLELQCELPLTDTMLVRAVSSG